VSKRWNYRFRFADLPIHTCWPNGGPRHPDLLFNQMPGTKGERGMSFCRRGRIRVL